MLHLPDVMPFGLVAGVEVSLRWFAMLLLTGEILRKGEMLRVRPDSLTREIIVLYQAAVDIEILRVAFKSMVSHMACDANHRSTAVITPGASKNCWLQSDENLNQF